VNIAILTAGTRGDTQPYVAVGIELRKIGHAVRIAAAENFESLVRPHGLDFHPVRGDIEKVASGDLAKNARKADNPLRFLFSLNKPAFKAMLLLALEDQFQACADADVIVYHPGAALGYFVARQRGIPAVLASPFPMTATREFPALLFYGSIRPGEAFNLLTHRLFAAMMWMAAGSPVKEFWKNRFGRVPAGFTCPYPLQDTREFPTVTSCSPQVFPRPRDWPEHAHMDGYWFIDDASDWAPPRDLVDFLSSGQAPVYVGFGSVGDAETAERTTEMVIAALRHAGQRGLLASGWSGLAHHAALPESVHMLRSAPHSWLFPRMAAVVHHGGAGTTAAGLRAGIPSVIIPHGNDQFAWGRRVHELRVGPAAIPRKKLTAEKLSAAITAALKDEVRQAAAELGRRIRAENGAAAAARVISASR
jgi:sterol 3beta-glucosyltransferase